MPSNMLSFINFKPLELYWTYFLALQTTTPKFPRWDSWAWIMSQKWDDVPWTWTMGFDAFLCKYGLFWALKEVFPKSMIMLTWCGSPMKWSHVMWKICPQQTYHRKIGCKYKIVEKKYFWEDIFLFWLLKLWKSFQPDIIILMIIVFKPVWVGSI